MKLSFLPCSNKREQTIWQFVIIKNKWTSVFHISVLIASWIHSYFDNVMTKFMINNKADAWKSDVNLLNTILLNTLLSMKETAFLHWWAEHWVVCLELQCLVKQRATCKWLEENSQSPSDQKKTKILKLCINILCYKQQTLSPFFKYTYIEV